MQVATNIGLESVGGQVQQTVSSFLIERLF